MGFEKSFGETNKMEQLEETKIMKLDDEMNNIVFEGEKYSLNESIKKFVPEEIYGILSEDIDLSDIIHGNYPISSDQNKRELIFLNNILDKFEIKKDSWGRELISLKKD